MNRGKISIPREPPAMSSRPSPGTTSRADSRRWSSVRSPADRRRHRLASGERIGVFAMQHGPGTENAFGGVAQAYGDSVPIVVLPGGYPRGRINIAPNFSAFLNYQHVTKWAEQVQVAAAAP